MGNVHSRQRYYEIAEDAFINAEDLQYEIGGPPCQGAILAYIDGAICARRMIHDCTPLELNEFQRLAYPIYARWAEANYDKFPCRPVRGRCQYPDEFIHSNACRYRVPLPPDIEYFSVAGPRPGHASHTHGRPGHHGFGGHSGPSNPRPGRRDNDRDYGGSYYGYSEDDYEYSEDEDGAAYSDEEDLHARSVSQTSDHGFNPGRRQGGATRGGASRGGTARGSANAQGRGSEGGAPDTGSARGGRAAAPGRASQGGASGGVAARGGRAAAPDGASRGGDADTRTTRVHGASTQEGSSRGQSSHQDAPLDQLPRGRSSRAGASLSEGTSVHDFADEDAAPRAGPSRGAAAQSSAPRTGTEKCHGGRRRR